MVFVIDGYNVLHRVPAWRAHFQRGLEAARGALIRFCCEWRHERRDVDAFWIVFDGAGQDEGQEAPGAHGVRVIYSAAGESADDRIVTLVDELQRFQACTVVSDDRAVQRQSRALAARIMSADAFYGVRRVSRGRAGTRWCNAGEASDKRLSEKDKQCINESLKREWGLAPEEHP